MRSGDAYVASLRDGRSVYLDGERIDDVTKHPAFVEPIRRVAEIYDRAKAAQSDPALTFDDPTSRARHSNMWLVPRSAEDLGARRDVVVGLGSSRIGGDVADGEPLREQRG